MKILDNRLFSFLCFASLLSLLLLVATTTFPFLS